MKSSIHSRPWAKAAPFKWLCAYRWRIGIRPRVDPFGVTGGLGDFTFLEAPSGHFHADPFIVEHKERVFLFFEDYSYLARSGTLACAELDRACHVLEVRTIVRQPYHLSYPHVFQFDGDYYLIPETASASRVDLYRAVNFPWEWRFEKVLLSGPKYQDVTCFESGGKCWLLAGGSSRPGKYDQLHVFHAPTIFDPFQPHPANPVKTDPGSARPAGCIIRDGDRLIRPAQDCTRWYGSGLTFMGIDVLSESAYSERPLTRLPDSWQGGRDLGIHTYNVSEHFEVIDVCTYGVEVRAAIGRARSLARTWTGPGEVSGPRPAAFRQPLTGLAGAQSLLHGFTPGIRRKEHDRENPHS